MLDHLWEVFATRRLLRPTAVVFEISQALCRLFLVCRQEANTGLKRLLGDFRVSKDAC